jgi:hypothetical protein
MYDPIYGGIIIVTWFHEILTQELQYLLKYNEPHSLTNYYQLQQDC